MSQSIVVEMTFLFHCFLMGIAVTAVYDIFLILRRVIRHNMLMVSLEDLVFWTICAISVFFMLYEENNGVLRWFAVLGAAIGMFLYKITISDAIVSIMSTVIKKIGVLIYKILRVLCKPIGFLWRKISGFFKVFSRKGRNAGKYVKIRLTSKIKLLTITLCKH